MSFWVTPDALFKSENPVVVKCETRKEEVKYAITNASCRDGGGRLIRKNTFLIILEVKKSDPPQCSHSTAGPSYNSYLLCCTFAFNSSRPTVATVLVGCLFLFFLSSFFGLSRRCSRCLIICFPPSSSREGRKGRRERRRQDEDDTRGTESRV